MGLWGPSAPVRGWEAEAIQKAGPKLEEARDLLCVSMRWMCHKGMCQRKGN